MLQDNTFQGRFTTPDMLWSAFPAQTPYHYSYNSPMTYRDPSGLAPEKEKEGERLQYWKTDWEKLYPYYEALWEENDRRAMFHLTADFKFRTTTEFGIGGGRTGGESGAYNGYGEMWMQSPGNKKWSEMTVEEKNATLKDANDLLRKLSAQNGNIWEWSYTICESEIEGTNFIIATNFQTNKTSEGVNPDLNVSSEYSIVATAHTHSGSNGDHSSGDLKNLYLTTVQQTVVYKNIDPNYFTSIVVSTKENVSELVHILQITDFDTFSKMVRLNFNTYFTEKTKWNFQSWREIVKDNLSVWGLQFNTLPIPKKDRPRPSMPGPRR